MASRSECCRAPLDRRRATWLLTNLDSEDRTIDENGYALICSDCECLIGAGLDLLPARTEATLVGVHA